MGRAISTPIKFEDALPDMDCLPETVTGRVFYEPTERGMEQRIKQRIEEIRERRLKKS